VLCCRKMRRCRSAIGRLKVFGLRHESVGGGGVEVAIQPSAYCWSLLLYDKEGRSAALNAACPEAWETRRDRIAGVRPLV
jgi:hypothetical protein